MASPASFVASGASSSSAAASPSPSPSSAGAGGAASSSSSGAGAASGSCSSSPSSSAAAGGAEDVQGLLDGAAPRVVVDMLLANESFKIAFDQDNPKRPDSASWTRYEAYKAATCGEQVLELGGSKSDVLHDYKKGFLRVTRCPAMIAYDLDRDAVAPEEPVTTGRPARRAPKRELFVAESATVDNKKLKGAE